MWRRGWAGLLAAGITGAATAQGFEVPAEWRHDLRIGRCGQAVKPINRALARGQVEAMLLAGLMFERGLCVKQDIDKAYALYEQAYAKGSPHAARHLAALAATTAGGADVAAVLWWARKEPSLLLSPGRWNCDPLPGRAEASADEIVEALKTWSQDRLEACRGLVGVAALLMAELRYPMPALLKDLQGSLLIAFDLQEGSHTVSWQGPAPPAGPLLDYVDALARDLIARVPRAQQALRGEFLAVFEIRSR